MSTLPSDIHTQRSTGPQNNVQSNTSPEEGNKDLPPVSGLLRDDDGNGEAVVLGKAMTFEEGVFLDMAKETVKNNSSTLSDALGRLITLNTALIGGGFIAAEGKVIGKEYAIVAVFFFIASLVFALRGIWPKRRMLVLREVDAVREFIESKNASTYSYSILSVILFLIGLAIATIGMMFTKPSTH